MIIQYELKRVSMGVITSDPQTVTGRDVTLSFSLPTEAAGEYFAVIIGQDGKDCKIRLNNLQCALPNKFIKTQSLRIEVLQVVDERIVKRWTCQPFRLSLIDDLLKATYEAAPDYNALQELYAALVERVDKQGEELAALSAENETLRQEVSKQKGELKTEISTDIVGLLRYKELNTNELKKIVNAVNALTDELNNLKSELNI